MAPVERKEKPWFRRAAPLAGQPRIAVIGGGIAGCAAARALQRRGATVRIFERHEGLAREGSGNPAGLITPRLTLDTGVGGRFHNDAFGHATALIDALESDGATIRHARPGVLIAAHDTAERDRQHRLLGHYGWPRRRMEAVDAEAAEKLAGLDAPLGGLWIAEGGGLSPAALIAALARDLPVACNTEIQALRRENGQWTLAGPDGAVIWSAEAVVLANGIHAGGLVPDAPLAMTANRGQISLVAGAGDHAAALYRGGYITPAFDLDGESRRVVGASYEKWSDLADGGWRGLREADHRRNLDALPIKDLGPALGGRAALRAITADRLPLAGPLFDAAAYRRDYTYLRHGKRPSSYPDATYVPGIYLFCGFGSQGLQTAPFAAETLGGLILGPPDRVATDLAEALHPARFLVRELRRRS